MDKRAAAALRADLDHTIVLPGSLHHLASFINIIGNRLFYINVLAFLASPDGLQRMPMIRRGNGDRIDILVIEQPAEIHLRFRFVAGDLFQIRHRF